MGRLKVLNSDVCSGEADITVESRGWTRSATMETSAWEQSSSVRSFGVDANVCVCRMPCRVCAY